MSDQPINYEAMLADLEAKKAKIEAAIAGIRLAIAMGNTDSGTVPPSGGGGGQYSGATPAHDAFIGMSIPDAAKKHLSAVRKKLSTQDLMTALEAGGLPSSKYSTVYAVLSRRESKVGDIINMKGDWALSEWYPNYTKKGKSAKASQDTDKGDSKDTENAAEKATA